jgi:hypothetical protein
VLTKESLIKSEYSINCHSGEYQNPVVSIVYWMLVGIYARRGTSMTVEVADQKVSNFIYRLVFLGVRHKVLVWRKE